jgi:hypothetical protein
LQRYVPGSDLAVDEMMLRFKGRSSLAFTQQPKPTPNGLKMIAVVDSKNGYFISGKIYARILGLSKEKIILDLVTGKNLENRTIVIDREYTTLGLVENLVKIGFQVVGTIKKYSNLPKEIRKIPKFQEPAARRRQWDRGSNEVDEAEEEDDMTVEAQDNDVEEEKNDQVHEEVDILNRGLKKGEWVWLSNLKIPAILIAWHDSGIRFAISTRHGANGTTVQRRAKGHVGKIIRTCPELN